MTRYLSNGTMGEMWMGDWCDRCEHDHSAHRGIEDGCPIIVRMLVDEYPIAELTEQNHAHTGWGSCCLHCSEFKPCVPCGIPTHYDPREHP